MLKYSISNFVILVFVTLTVSAVDAQPSENDMLSTTPWHEIDGGRVRVAIEPKWQDHKREGLIEVNLKPGWKTYWRNPGNSGMAPSFSFRSKVNYQIAYPVPQLYKDGDDWSIGYKNNVIFPFVISGDTSPTRLDGSLTIGICEKICIPLNVDFVFDENDGKEPSLSRAYLDIAKGKLPQNAGEDIFIKAEKKDNRLFITFFHPDRVKISALYLDGGDCEIGLAKQVSYQAKTSTFEAEVIYSKQNKTFAIHYTADAEPAPFSGVINIANP